MNTNEVALDDEISGIPASGIKETLVINGPVVTLDLGRTRCPMLGLKSMKVLRSLKPGQALEIASTGTGAGKALKRVSRMTGTKIIAAYEEDGQFKHLLRKD